MATTLKVWTGPVYVKQYADKIAECGFPVMAGTEHVYVAVAYPADTAVGDFLAAYRNHHGTSVGDCRTVKRR